MHCLNNITIQALQMSNIWNAWSMMNKLSLEYNCVFFSLNKLSASVYLSTNLFYYCRLETWGFLEEFIGCLLICNLKADISGWDDRPQLSIYLQPSLCETLGFNALFGVAATRLQSPNAW